VHVVDDGLHRPADGAAIATLDVCVDVDDRHDRAVPAVLLTGMVRSALMLRIWFCGVCTMARFARPVLGSSQ
jgi:hypothetical protein